MMNRSRSSPLSIAVPRSVVRDDFHSGLQRLLIHPVHIPLRLRHKLGAARHGMAFLGEFVVAVDAIEPLATDSIAELEECHGFSFTGYNLRHNFSRARAASSESACSK